MNDLRRQGWLTKGPFGYIVLHHQAGEHFLRSRSATFPWLTIAELFGVQRQFDVQSTVEQRPQIEAATIELYESP